MKYLIIALLTMGIFMSTSSIQAADGAVEGTARDAACMSIEEFACSNGGHLYKTGGGNYYMVWSGMNGSWDADCSSTCTVHYGGTSTTGYHSGITFDEGGENEEDANLDLFLKNGRLQHGGGGTTVYDGAGVQCMPGSLGCEAEEELSQ